MLHILFLSLQALLMVLLLRLWLSLVLLYCDWLVMDPLVGLEVQLLCSYLEVWGCMVLVNLCHEAASGWVLVYREWRHFGPSRYGNLLQVQHLLTKILIHNCKNVNRKPTSGQTLGSERCIAVAYKTSRLTILVLHLGLQRG